MSDADMAQYSQLHICDVAMFAAHSGSENIHMYRTESYLISCVCVQMLDLSVSTLRQHTDFVIWIYVACALCSVGGEAHRRKKNGMEARKTDTTICTGGSWFFDLAAGGVKKSEKSDAIHAFGVCSVKSTLLYAIILWAKASSCNQNRDERYETFADPS